MVAATGVAEAAAIGSRAHTLIGLLPPLAILILTVVLAVWVYRFAKRNANMIGEARFKTTRD